MGTKKGEENTRQMDVIDHARKRANDWRLQQYQVGLVVMASHGRGWLGRLVLGSVAKQVLSHVNVPMLLVRRPLV